MTTRTTMKKKETTPAGFIEAIKKLKHAGLVSSPSPNRTTGSIDDMPSLDKRIAFLLGIARDTKRKATDMLFFVMYDIEDNRVRRYVAKYLEKQGCMRIQKSIFLANLNTSKYKEIKSDLAAVQAAYDNADSILVAPISTDYLKSMTVIGKSINLDIITRSKSTLFF